MNDRIKQLAEQAGMTDDKFGMFFAKDKHNEDGVDLEKFAELIVEECRNVITEVYHKTPLKLCGPLLTADEEIAKHFYGVPE